jgi:hypothetical protein
MASRLDKKYNLVSSISSSVKLLLRRTLHLLVHWETFTEASEKAKCSNLISDLFHASKHLEIAKETKAKSIFASEPWKKKH